MSGFSTDVDNSNEGTTKNQRGSDASPSAQPHRATPSFPFRLCFSFTPQPTHSGLCCLRRTARFRRALGLHRLSAQRWQNRRLLLSRPEANSDKGGPIMVANSLFLTIGILLALGFWLL